MNKNNENLIYLETYKDIDLYQYINIPGIVGFYLEGEHRCFGIVEAKKLVDSIAMFTKVDYTNLLSKLSEKEQTFVTTIVDELKPHIDACCCELGVDIPYYINNF